MSDFKFKSTVDPKTLYKVFAVCATEWGLADPEGFATHQTKQLVEAILGGRAAKAYYLESKEGEIAVVCVISHHKAFFKDAGGVSGLKVPDPASFGVSPATALRLSYVFTLGKFRGQGLMAKLLKRAITVTEEEVLKKELEKSSDKKGSFKDMVTDSSGQVDPQLASYYLGKKYVWYLYSAIKTTYAKFGFKGYPADGFIIPKTILDGEAHELVQKLLSSKTGTHERAPGKQLTLLDGEKQQDRDIIALILQMKEVDLLTELSKSLFHSELSGGRRSSSSLTNLQTAISSTKLGSQNELAGLTNLLESTKLQPGAKNEGGRNRSSIQTLNMPKVFLLPDIANLRKQHESDEARTKKTGGDSKYAHIKGAILRNDLQQKSHYVIWSQIMDGRFFIIDLGELKIDIIGGLSDPTRVEDKFGGRRRSSFTGINDLGGYNFQDLELLISTAAFVAQKRNPELDRIYVTSHALPDNIPPQVLYDFFINYLPRSVPNVLKKEEEGAHSGNTVEYVEDFSDFHLLPMMKRYGSDSPEFDLDWIGSGSLITWG